MYKTFYRMQTEAFLSLPSPDIFFTSRTHKIAWNYLIYGIKEHEPYLLVAGDYGMGKTLLCLKLVKALQTKDLYPFTYISNSNYSYATIIREIVKRLGLTIHTEDEASLQRMLYDYFEAQKPLQPFYCILDDVQEFDPMTLVKLRLLANFNASGVFPLRMIFFAHTSFLERLKSPSMEPLDQRIKRRYTLIPFDLHDTKEYIYFRLLQAGAVMSPYFTDAAIGHLFEHTGGIPRLINNICDACLLIGASREMEEIDAPLVDEAVEYLGWRRHDIEHQDIPYVAEEEAKEAEQEPRPDQREEEEPDRGYAYERSGGGGEREGFVRTFTETIPPARDTYEAKQETINYAAAEQRDINRNIPNRHKGQGINVPEAHKTPVRRFVAGSSAVSDGLKPESISGPERKKDTGIETGLAGGYIKEHPLGDKLITLQKPDSISAEMFKVIRGMILYNKNRPAPKAIMITSALPGEGKTFVASNLAVSFAKSLNEKVLLIDSDLRNPSVHKMFGYANEYGLSDHLQGRRDIPELLIKTEVDQLTLLLSGEPPSNPVELLSSKKMGDFINEAKNRYHDRFIIIDSTPSRITAETNVIANHVDGIILVVMNGKTPRALLQQTVENLERKKILGIVFNDYAQTSKYYHKYYKKYYK